MPGTGPEATPIEIERKFLVRDPGWPRPVRGERLIQGYLSTDARATVRVRVGDAHSFLTIKGAPRGLSTPEFEYEIPRAHATALLRLCGDTQVEKTRYRVPVEEHVFEIDVFEGRNRGLVLAEVELSREDEAFSQPSWLGPEVSHDPRFKNARLAREPFDPAWIPDTGPAHP